MDEIVQLSILYDFYGELLSEHKKQIFEDYVLNDLSLSEIAQERGLSRQGVHDIVKRCAIQLREYEDKLGLIRKFHSIKDKVEKIKTILSNISDKGEMGSTDTKDLELIQTLADDILKEL
ncbi:MAG: DNA-binding protein [Clostridiales bacterium]|nr:DNA-binding protein [Clostridiales bacterium]